MNNFIKLSSSVINKSHIIEIIHKPAIDVIHKSSKYYLYMSNNIINGFFFNTTGTGVSANTNVIKICEKYDKQDYDIITNFIKEIK